LIYRDRDPRFRNLAGVVALLLVAGAGAVLVRTVRKPAPSVLGIRESAPPFVVESTAPSPSFSAQPTFSAPPAPMPPATEPSSSPPPSTSSPLPASCHNSFSASCGTFRWTSSPGTNGSMRISVSYPSGGLTGKPVTFTVTLTDPDAKPSGVWPHWGDGSGSTPPSCGTRYGPWDPPARSGGTTSYTLKHTYSRAGTYTVYFVGRSGTCGSPYANEIVSQSIRITIDQTGSDPTPSPTPSETPFPI
jgi:hypothetical protein